jgi:hypothetical protein
MNRKLLIPAKHIKVVREFPSLDLNFLLRQEKILGEEYGRVPYPASLSERKNERRNSFKTTSMVGDCP